MKKFVTYIECGRFAVGTTGRAVHVFDGSGKELASFRDLTYAYNAAFTSSEDKLIVKSTDGMLALYSLTDLKLLKKHRFGSAPQDGGFCFSKDGRQFLNVASKNAPRRHEVNAYSTDDLLELGTIFSSEKFGVIDIECGDEDEYYVLGNDGGDTFAGLIRDGKLIEIHHVSFDRFMLYMDALRLRRSGYTEACYKSTFASTAALTGILSNSFSLEDFKKADLGLKKLLDELRSDK